MAAAPVPARLIRKNSQPQGFDQRQGRVRPSVWTTAILPLPIPGVIQVTPSCLSSYMRVTRPGPVLPGGWLQWFRYSALLGTVSPGAGGTGPDLAAHKLAIRSSWVIITVIDRHSARLAPWWYG